MTKMMRKALICLVTCLMTVHHVSGACDTTIDITNQCLDVSSEYSDLLDNMADVQADLNHVSTYEIIQLKNKIYSVKDAIMAELDTLYESASACCHGESEAICSCHGKEQTSHYYSNANNLLEYPVERCGCYHGPCGCKDGQRLGYPAPQGSVDVSCVDLPKCIPLDTPFGYPGMKLNDTIDKIQIGSGISADECFQLCQSQEDCMGVEYCGPDKTCYKVTEVTVCSQPMIPDACCYTILKDLCDPECGQRADVVFILDRSGSVGLYWSDILDFATDVVSHPSISIGSDLFRVGVVSFSHWARNDFFLEDFFSEADLINAIGGIGFTGGGTNIESGILLAQNDQFIPSKGEREDVPNIAIILTDGWAWPDPIPSAINLQQFAQVYTVGVGQYVNQAQIIGMSSPPQEEDKNWFLAPDFESLELLVDAIVKEVTSCSVGAGQGAVGGAGGTAFRKKIATVAPPQPASTTCTHICDPGTVKTWYDGYAIEFNCPIGMNARSVSGVYAAQANFLANNDTDQSACYYQGTGDMCGSNKIDHSEMANILRDCPLTQNCTLTTAWKTDTFTVAAKIWESLVIAGYSGGCVAKGSSYNCVEVVYSCYYTKASA